MKRDDFRIIIIAIISMFLLISLVEAKDINCDKHQIYCHIKRLKPKMTYEKAMELSNVFYKSAKKYEVSNPIRSVAIAMQETSFNLHKSRSQNVIVFSEDMSDYKIVRGYSDICMFQFHVDTIVNEKLDPIRLKTDSDYCIEQHFKLLKKKMKVCQHLKEEAWTCYHSKTYKLRKRYKEDVERHL